MEEKLSDVQVSQHQIDIKPAWAVQLSRALPSPFIWRGQVPPGCRNSSDRGLCDTAAVTPLL